MIQAYFLACWSFAFCAPHRKYASSSYFFLLRPFGANAGKVSIGRVRYLLSIMFYTFRCSNHLFSVVYMYSYMYASDNGAGRRALERSYMKKRRGIFFESEALKKNIFFFFTSELAPSAYFFLGWLAGWQFEPL